MHAINWPKSTSKWPIQEHKSSTPQCIIMWDMILEWLLKPWAISNRFFSISRQACKTSELNAVPGFSIAGSNIISKSPSMWIVPRAENLHGMWNVSRLLLPKMKTIYQTYQRKTGNVLIVDHLEQIFLIPLSEFTIWSDRCEILLYDTTKQSHHSIICWVCVSSKVLDFKQYNTVIGYKKGWSFIFLHHYIHSNDFSFM